MQSSLIPVEYLAERVLTTEQLAQSYECSTDNIKVNFNANKERFEEGKHFFKLEGEELKNLRVENPYLQISSMTRMLYLWTKRGAARHSKMLGTDKAWEIFEALEENYFNQKESLKTPAQIQLTFSGILCDVDESKTLIQKIYGTQDGIATAHATFMVDKFYGHDLSALQKLISSAD